MALTAPLMAQDGVKEGVIHKQIQADNPFCSIQVAKGDKTGAMLNSVYVLPDVGTGNYDPEQGFNWIDYSGVDEIFFFCNYTALFTTKVRFRLVITGPEFFSRTSDNWYNAKYKTNSFYYVNGPKASFFSKSGEYKVIFYVEQQKPLGGSQCVASCTIRVY